MRGRIYFKPGAIQHIYQNTCNGFLIFYSVKDCIVFFTIFCTVARRHRIRVLGLCLMADHIHVLTEVESRESLSSFVQHYTTWFSQVYNKWHGQCGQFFRSPFGFAAKVSDKEIRSAIAYLYNNPVEKQLCRRPEESQWNFLAYGASRNPFSEPIRRDRASAALRQAIKEVDFERNSGRPLNYVQLSLMFEKLTSEEKRHLTDYIIRSYNCIDYNAAAKYFGGFADLVAGINVAKGSEYNIREDFTPGSDKAYAIMTDYLVKTNRIRHIDELLLLGEEERLALMEPLVYNVNASYKKVAKYLHLVFSPGD